MVTVAKVVRVGHEKIWLTVRGESDVQWGQVREKKIE